MEHALSMKKIIFLFLVLGILIPSTLGFAKGEFDYIVIKGPGITGERNQYPQNKKQIDYFSH